MIMGGLPGAAEQSAWTLLCSVRAGTCLAPARLPFHREETLWDEYPEALQSNYQIVMRVVGVLTRLHLRTGIAWLQCLSRRLLKLKDFRGYVFSLKIACFKQLPASYQKRFVPPLIQVPNRNELKEPWFFCCCKHWFISLAVISIHAVC